MWEKSFRKSLFLTSTWTLLAFRLILALLKVRTSLPKRNAKHGTNRWKQGATSTTINVEATDVCPAPFYEGVIETELGDLTAIAEDALY